MAAAPSRLASLKTEHARLDEEIRQELAHPLPDSLRIQELKRRKLRLKEVIQLTERQDPVKSESSHDRHATEAVHH